MNTESIALVCHEAVKAYCAMIGDDTHRHWGEAEARHIRQDIADVDFRLRNPEAPDSSQHDFWMARKFQDGWVFAPTLNRDAKQHPHLMPFDGLPREIQLKDLLFKQIVLCLQP